MGCEAFHSAQPVAEPVRVSPKPYGLAHNSPFLGSGDFFGDGSLAGQGLRMGSATAMTDGAVLRIDKKAMMEALHREHDISDIFVAYLLARNVRYEADLVDQLFNSSERRLACVLLLLAHFGKEGKPESVVPKISQETSQR
jgi:CRP/FNR family cyclic AMP-dependent transcriptional regulator